MISIVGCRSRTRSGPSSKEIPNRRIVVTHVVSGEVVDGGLGEHGVVLELTLAERRSVSGDDDQLGLAGLLRLLVDHSRMFCTAIA